MSQIKVLVIDDSALVRQTLNTLLSDDGRFEVITAPNAMIGDKKLDKYKPDVIILDVEMPEIDGITFLKQVMAEKPLPVVLCSGMTPKGSQRALEALDAGAVEIIEKPQLGTKRFLEESKTKIIDAILASVKVEVKKITRKKTTDKKPMVVQPKLTADAVLSLPKTQFEGKTDKVIVIGASTGGTEALQYVLERLPDNLPPILIVQHMPEHFTKAFAERLDRCCPPKIEEAVNNRVLERGLVLIAPGNYHLLLKRRGRQYYTEVREGALVSRHRPSVDVLFRSAARYAGKNAVGVIMTGMGDDGARGMQEMRQTGAETVAQDEKSCVVFGMPKEAIKHGGVAYVVPLELIPQKILELSVK